jgi:hypothetical protein
MDMKGLLGGLLGQAPQSPAPLPMDPMDEALPPYLRQFYGSPGSAPTLPPPALQRPQPGQTEAPRDPALMERAMSAARQAYESVLSGGSGLLGDIGDAADTAGDYAGRAAGAVGDAASAINDKRKEIDARHRERMHTEGMNRARKETSDVARNPNLMPPLPLRDPNDPYYGREYPSLKRPQPGQDWEGIPPVEGEWADKYYTPQEERRRVSVPSTRRT